MARQLNQNVVDMSSQIDDDVLDAAGMTGVRRFDADKASMAPWLKRRANVRKLNAMLRETRNFPWPGAAKGCVPIINIAVHQFRARALPELAPAKGTVNVRHTGWEDASRAIRVEKAMNDQLRHVRRYQQELGNMLSQVALDGTAFRKCWWDEMRGELAFKTVSASDLVASYSYTGDIRDCRRITHVLWMYPDEIAERRAAGYYNSNADDLKGGSTAGVGDGADTDAIRDASRNIEGVVVGEDHERHEKPDNDPTPDDNPRMLLEQHTWLDLDGDDISEPYVVTIDYETKKVIRILSREYEEAGVTKVMHFFTKFDFFPNPDGFYGFGLGSLLENYNALANALVNMLLDSGTLQNTQRGLMSTKCGLGRGDLMWRPGEIKLFDGMVSDIRQEFMELPAPVPSNVLLSLLGLIQGWGKEIASVNDIMQGLEQAANQTATTTITLVEQGLKLFSAVHKGLRDSLKEELELAYLLNRMHLSDEQYNSILGNDGSEEWAMWNQARMEYQQMVMQAMPLLVQGQDVPLPPAPPEFPFMVALDFSAGHDIQPEADPEVVGQAQRAVVAKENLQAIQMNPHTQTDVAVNREALRRYFTSMNEVDVDKLLPQLPPEPEPPQQQDQHLENAQFIMGDIERPHVFEEDNHAEHLRKMDDLFDGPEWEHMDPARKAAAEQHRAEHEAYFYLQKQGVMSEQPGMAVPAPAGAAPALPAVPGGLQSMAGPSMYAGLSPQTGPGEALDNAPGSLLGRFDLASAARAA